jgi:hypothetical protein
LTSVLLPAEAVATQSFDELVAEDVTRRQQRQQDLAEWVPPAQETVEQANPAPGRTY